MQNSIDSVTAQDLVDIIKAQLQRYYTDINIIYSFTDSNYICELFLMQVSMIFYIFTNLQFMIYLKISEIIMIPGQFVICYPTSDCNPLIFMDDFFSFFLDFIHDSHFFVISSIESPFLYLSSWSTQLFWFFLLQKIITIFPCSVKTSVS